MGTSRTLASFHFGQPGSGRKAYIQAGLHADEAPGPLVAMRLIEYLTKAEMNGDITGELIVVPIANPIGLAQWTTDGVEGRHDRFDHINFNRSHLDLSAKVAEKVSGHLGDDADANIARIRQAIREEATQLEPVGETAYLKRLLFTLSCDSDIVLDLHCDLQAVMHVYTGTALWPAATDLSAQMGALATLLAIDSGGCPFDEANSKIWWQLAREFPQYPIPPGCLSATVELRGFADTDRNHTDEDTANLLIFLQRRGFLRGEAPPLPELTHGATPLEGVDYVKVRETGILSFVKKPGEIIQEGEVIAYITNPLAGERGLSTPVLSRTTGTLFAIAGERFARPGKIVAKIAGTKPLAEDPSQLLTI